MALPYTSSYDETIGFSDTDAQLFLTSGANLGYILPLTANISYTILFSYNDTANVFVGYNATPTIPGSGVITTLQRVEYRPKKRYARGGDVLTFSTPDATVYMGISVRQITT